MFVWHYRPIFETNSSSSHALVWCFDESEFVPSFPSSGFSWEWFFLRSTEWKLAYLVAQVLESGFPAEKTRELISGLFSLEELAVVLTTNATLTVDHQSRWPRFVTPEGEPALEFYRELKKFVLLPQIAVKGGSDASICSYEFPRVETFPWFVGDIDLWVQKNGNYWIVLSPTTGERYRVSFCALKSLEPVFPETIDVKICTYCPRECPWCYESASRYGTFAPLERIKKFFDSISGKVLEVALGGGEPLTHPDLVQILECARSKHIVVNITTHSFELLARHSDVLRELVGAIGITVTSKEDYEEFLRVRESHFRGRRPKFVIHVVEGITPFEVVERIPLPILVLGFKPFGRARSMRVKPWPPELFEGWERPGPDTTMLWGVRYVMFDTWYVERHPQVLTVPRARWFSGWDGEFTMAVDLVECKVGPASYLPMEPFEVGSPIEEIFEKVRKEVKNDEGRDHRGYGQSCGGSSQGA